MWIASVIIVTLACFNLSTEAFEAYNESSMIFFKTLSEVIYKSFASYRLCLHLKCANRKRASRTSFSPFIWRWWSFLMRDVFLILFIETAQVDVANAIEHHRTHNYSDRRDLSFTCFSILHISSFFFQISIFILISVKWQKFRRLIRCNRQTGKAALGQPEFCVALPKSSA